MKKANKIIAVILAMILSLSSLPVIASAGAIKDDVDTFEELIQPDSLSYLVDWLLKKLNDRKEEVTGTVLQLVYMFVDDIDTGSLDIMNASDEQLAKVLIDWLNANLPVWTEGITGQSWWPTVTGLLSIAVTIDLEDVDGIFETLYSLTSTTLIKLGDVSKIDNSALYFTEKGFLGIEKKVMKTVANTGDLGMIYSLFEFLADNTFLFDKALKGTLTLGALGNINIGDKSINATINDAVQEFVSPASIKAMLIDLFELGGELAYTPGDVDADNSISSSDARLTLRASVGLENLDSVAAMAANVDGDATISSADARLILRASVGLETLPSGGVNYDNFTVDELVAAAFLKLLTGTEGSSKEEAAQVMAYTIFELLENYAGEIYANLLLDLINNDAKQALNDLAAKDTTGKLKEVVNLDYTFEADTFDDFLGAGKGNMVEQLNNLVIALLKIILTEDAFTALALEEGDNTKLNSNLTKTFRYVLPLINDLDLGVDLSGFTTEAVADMEAEEMAVAVLKLFFVGWFHLDESETVNIDKAETLEQLGVLAAYYAVSNKDWVPMEIKAAATLPDITALTDDQCIDLIFEIGMETAAKALDYNKTTTYYELPADTSAWTGVDYLDDIVDWGLNFVDGIPASADKLSTQRHKLDGNGGFYKLNVVLNSLFDLSFISGCGNGEFPFDMETMLMDNLLGNILDFDIAASVSILEENEDSALFDKAVNKAVIDLVDDLLTGLFVA